MAVDTSSNGVSDAVKQEVNGTSEDSLKGINGKSEGTNGHSEETKPSSTEKEEKKPGEPRPEDGSVAESKPLYKSPKDADGNWTWVDKYPEDAHEAAENDETATFAVIVRQKKSQDARKKLEIDSLVIQSKWIKSALGKILVDYPGVVTDLDRLEFDAPFAPFVHRWQKFVDYLGRTDLDAKTTEHLKLLYDILEKELRDDLKAYKDYILKGVVTFKHLWMVFEPGSVVVAAHAGPLSAFELADTAYVELKCGNAFKLETQCVEHDGKRFGRSGDNMFIFEFRGSKSISSLKAYPMEFHEHEDSLKAILTARGRKFESLTGYQFKQYDGTAINWDRDGNEVPVHIKGRIIIDVGAFRRHAPWQVPQRNISDLNDAAAAHVPRSSAENDGEEDDDGEDELEDVAETLDGVDENDVPKVKLTEYQHLICRSRTRGYNLKSKQWLDFYIDNISEISWNSTAFDNLVLPEDQKELILAFSESQVANRENFDDVISGKGKGVIMLLSGPPGVGKTLTAEAVAEDMHVPLHTMSGGDLGSTPWELERSLTDMLDLVSRWNAILLLDECDVFLEARANNDLERNKVVSIFLRTLEYYEGILFLTTNRVSQIDDAFSSRIHVSMEYPDLTPTSRKQIWRNFLQAMSRLDGFTDSDLKDLSEIKLNGRQIKNILKTAQLLASRKKQPLNRKVIDAVLVIENRRPEKAKQLGS